MGCACSVNNKHNGTKQSGCSTGGCNKLNAFDWFTKIPISSNERSFNVVEISFNLGTRKAYYRNTKRLELYKGDLVVVEAAQGYDIGEVNLQGELVKLQMRKNKVKDKSDTVRNIFRKPTEADLKIFEKAQLKQKESLVQARVIARSRDLAMKISLIEYQADCKKMTIYFTSDERVDFRDLVKEYASTFKCIIEMRQIGDRQEAAKIGGIGDCGRELCCSTWLTNFKNVNISAARYQQLSINAEKISGQCGRLKCCLNYELDTYMDALTHFPKNLKKLETKEGVAYLVKTEIFKEQMTFKYKGSHQFHKLKLEDVKKIVEMNKAKKKPESLIDFAQIEEMEEKTTDLVGHVSLSLLDKKDKKRRRSKSNSRNGGRGNNSRQNRNNKRS